MVALWSGLGNPHPGRMLPVAVAHSRRASEVEAVILAGFALIAATRFAFAVPAAPRTAHNRRRRGPSRSTCRARQTHRLAAERLRVGQPSPCLVRVSASSPVALRPV